MNGRRYRIIPCTAEVLVSLCKPGPPRLLQVTENPLPEDAQVVRATYSAERDIVLVVIESESFKPVNEGDVIPWLPSPVLSATPLIVENP